MMDADTIRAALRCDKPGCPCRGESGNVHCLAHTDSDPSLSVHMGTDGKLLVKCFGPCSQGAVVAALKARGLWPSNSGAIGSGKGRGPRREVVSYDYTDENGACLFQVVRFDPKGFSQRRPNGKGGWIWSLYENKTLVVRLVLYRLPDVVKAGTVLIVEGEKDVATAYRLGLPDGWWATCNPMGAGKWRDEYSESLRGKRVVILPDADDAGRKHLQVVGQALQGIASEVLTVSLPHGKDLSEWTEAGGTAADFALLLDQAEPYRAEGECKGKDAGPWSKAQAAKDFLSAIDNDVAMLEEKILARGSITEWFSPRGIGKTHGAHSLIVKLARADYRVLLLDRDNSRREVKRRLRAWGAEELTILKVMTRDDVPSLTDAAQWKDFPFQDYDVVLIDSLESSTEGCGEQDSAKPSKAIAPLLDIAHRENGPAILVLGNTIKSGAHSRGSGVVEDRADVAFEIRDATDFKPSGTKDWWLELPAAGAADWGNRASRRRHRDTYRLAFIASKYRLGEEPDPFIWEISMPNGETWTVRDVTADVMKAGEDAKQSVDAERSATLDRTGLALADQVRQRAEADDPMLSGEAVQYLKEDHNLTQKAARQLVKDQIGTLWDCIKGTGKGHPQILVPLGYKTNMAAEMPSEEKPQLTGYKNEPHAYPVDSTCHKGSAFSSQQQLTTYKRLCGVELTG